MGATTVRNVRLEIEYDGLSFHGWQHQPGLRTVQGAMENALGTMLHERVVVSGAGRTDAGVHALGQVANFKTHSPLPLERIARGLEALVGTDFVVRAIEEADGDFHARHSARARHYAYVLLRERSALWYRRAWRPRSFPDAERMNRALRYLLREADFGAFCCRNRDQESTTTRLLYAEWVPWGRGLVLRIGAVRFLYKMVRSIVGRCLEVGLGRREPEWFLDLLGHPEVGSGTVAPPWALYLVGVSYDEKARAPSLVRLLPGFSESSA